MSDQPISFGTWCSGIEAASKAWLPLGWRCAYVAEIEPFPCAYLADRHGASRPLRMPDPTETPNLKERVRRRAALKALDRIPSYGIRWGDLPNFGDITQLQARELPQVDIIGVGFPCQDFSIAGLRASLSGDRGNLSIIGVRLLLELAQLGLVRGALLEQVPDVLNTEDNAWGNILGALVGADDPLAGLEHGGKWPGQGMVEGPRARIAWRICDAQRWGLAQRRERVFAIVDFGDGPDPAAVLFERKGVSGHSSARAQARKDVAGTLAGGSRGRGGYSEDDLPHVADTLRGHPRPGSNSVGALAFGGNNPGALDVATARNAHGGPCGRMEFESETFVAEVTPPLTSNPYGDHEAREGLLVANTVGAHHNPARSADQGNIVAVAHSLRGEGFDASEDGTGRRTPIVPIAFNARQDPISGPVVGPVVGPVDTASGTHAIAFSLRGREGGAMPEVEGDDVYPALRSAEGGSTRAFVAFDETQVTSKTNRSQPKPGAPCHPLTAQGRPPTLAWLIMPQNSNKDFKARQVEVSQPVMAAGPAGGCRSGDFVQSGIAVRRITCVEAEVLQGFPPNATLINWPTANREGADLAETIAYLRQHGFDSEDAERLAQTPDGPRYKAIGNSWPVPVVRWIGEGIQAAMPLAPSPDDIEIPSFLRRLADG